MIALVVTCGLGVGAGLVGIVFGVRPARPLAGSVLRSLDVGGARVRAAAEVGSSRWPHRTLGARLARILDDRGWLPAPLIALSRATRRPVHDLCAESILGCVTGLLLPPIAVFLMTAAGLSLPFAVPIWLSLTTGAGGAALPLITTRGVVRHSRREARVVTAAYLDLVVLALAGGMGIEGALHAAAAVAQGDFSSRVVDALELARDAGETPWQALADLGEDLGVPELVELAAAVRLAGTEGARIRNTLAVKAASMRRHELAEVETEANTVTERLFLPGVLLLVGFLVFVGYPAVARITGGF